MIYSEDYFLLQLEFAKKVNQLTDLGLSRALIDYTTFYKSFGISGWDFDIHHPTWVNYLDSINKEPQRSLGITYEFYLKADREEDLFSRFGCFSYEYDSMTKVIRIHFNNRDNSGLSPLSKERMVERKKELKEMFTDISCQHPEAEKVLGFSWLYNLDAYKRLFPKSYVESGEKVGGWFKTNALWGQFLSRDGKLREGAKEKFLGRLGKVKGKDNLQECFPFLIIKTEGELAAFFENLGLKSS